MAIDDALMCVYVENTIDSTWVHVPSGDFHLAPAATMAIDDGDPQWTTAVPEDFEGNDRGTDPDAGWDERL